MHMTATFSMVGKLFFELLIDIICAPIWWYSDGVRWIVRKLSGSLISTWQETAISVWLKNIWVPMYGQYDFWGRLISFFIRLFQIIFRLLWIFLWLILMFFVFCLWLVAPLAAWGLLIYSIVH